ncbi:unnamed protein product [Amoebophrya sp. A120]|nr:unnamed protein product [Amoebophrya sp. A120]|eukprot:GSA120T00004601001.1
MRFRPQFALSFLICLAWDAKITAARAAAAGSEQVAGTGEVLPPSSTAAANAGAAGSRFFATARDALSKMCAKRLCLQNLQKNGVPSTAHLPAGRDGKEWRSELRQRNLGLERSRTEVSTEQRESQLVVVEDLGKAARSSRSGRIRGAGGVVPMMPGPLTSEIFWRTAKRDSESDSVLGGFARTDEAVGKSVATDVVRSLAFGAQNGTRNSKNDPLTTTAKQDEGGRDGHRERDRRRPPAADARNGSLSMEDGLLFLGHEKDDLLNRGSGILSFLSPKQTTAVLGLSKEFAPSGNLGSRVTTAAKAQHKNDVALASRTESCADLFLQALREKVADRKPRDFWNTGIDGAGLDYLQGFVASDTKPEEGQPLIGSDIDWSVKLLMVMAGQTCNPLAAYRRVEDAEARAGLYHRRNLETGCHVTDIDFFREVLSFFHEDVADSVALKNPGGVEGENPTRKVVVWSPALTNSFGARENMALNPNQTELDGRCRLAMATELLFQRQMEVYEVMDFIVKHGYCLNPDSNSEIERQYRRSDPLNDNWHIFFRKLFRQFAQKWRRGSDGRDPRWSYDQFLWDWRTTHAKRFSTRSARRELCPSRPSECPLPKVLAKHHEKYGVTLPTEIEYDGRWTRSV